MNLSINNLNKTYSNNTKAIDNLSLTIEKGMFGLLGPNGAGKSSLMRTIATLQLPDSGNIQFQEIDALKNQMQLRQVLGYLPQSFGVYQSVSAEHLLDYFAILKGISSKKDRQKIVQHVLELTNLYDVRKKHVSGYSGGMKQRFGIAQLLLNTPKLIIVDEPTAGLDPEERNRFLNVLREVGSENTVIFSTHIVEDVKELCTDMAIMNKGRILQKIKPSEATKAIKNEIWTTTIEKQYLKNMTDKYSVLSTSYNEDNLLNIRVHSQERPAIQFENAIPNLEDVYFIALKNS
nr:ABC transporter ATP-binding protein [uncultured Psychroserpens sp.]